MTFTSTPNTCAAGTSSTPDLTLVVSPYLVGPADPALHTASAIASRVVTYLPAPREFNGTEAGRTRVKAAAHAYPEYLRLLDAWSWTVPLWKSGVMRGAVDGDCPQREAPGVERDLRGDPKLKLAASAIKPGLLERDQDYLASVCADILKGGADPGLTTLVAAALDRFCARRGYVCVRAGPGPKGTPSVVHRGEQALCNRLFGVAIPMPVQASGAWVCSLRDGLRAELASLRGAILGALAGGSIERLNESAGLYSDAFARWRRDVAPPVTDDDLGRRVVDAVVSITGATMPADAALRASAAAIRASGLARPDASGGAAPAPSQRVPVLTIRRMNVQPHAVHGASRSHARTAQ